MMACVDAPRCAKDVSRAMGLPLTTVYRQVHRLLDLGVLVVERSAMTAGGRKCDLYRSRVREARMFVDAGGERVEWETNGPIEAVAQPRWVLIPADAHG